MTTSFYLKRHHGLALIQVLLLSVMLSVLMISVVFNSKSQLIEAVKVQQRADAMVKLHSQESEVLFSLLTHSRKQQSSVLELPNHWNFYGESVAIQDGEVQIRDVAGFFSIYNIKQMKYVFDVHGINAAEATMASNDLNVLRLPRGFIPEYMQRYIDSAEPLPVRNASLQLVDELRFIQGVDDKIFRQLAPNLTTYPSRTVNPAAMTAEQMALYISEPALSIVLSLRNEGKLTPENFLELTGLEFDQGFSPLPSNVLELSFTAVLNDVKLRRKLTVVINPYETIPFYFWEYQKYSHVN
ncbi:MAG: general secretion pathway protein GspK [Gammaproteobacteria bacterium]|nr:general secretion pathway protein GspK [Gammaproteobacteria bacterium]